VLAIGAAVAAPAFARAVQYSVAGSDIASGPPSERIVAVVRNVVLRPLDPNHPGSAPDDDPSLIERVMPSALRINGFDGVYESSMTAAGGREAGDYTNPDNRSVTLNTIIAFRSDACAHVVLVAGRCVAAPMEVMISQPSAEKVAGGVGSTVQIQFARPVNTPDGVQDFPIGNPLTLSVVGVYQAPDLQGDPYWSATAFTEAGPDYLTGLIGPDTLTAMNPYHVDQRYVLYPTSSGLDPDRLTAVKADLTASYARIKQTGPAPSSQLPALLDAVSADQQRVAVGTTVAGAPLVVLCWFVIFLAVAQTAQARRPELALVKLRGAAVLDRWWLSAAESVVPLVVGAVVGFVVGPLAVLAYGRMTLAHPAPVEFTGTGLRYAAVALVGALTAGLLALRRDLAAPIADLMRRATRTMPRWQSAVIASGAVALAGLAVFEAHTNLTAQPSGLVLLGPALIVLAIGLVLAGLLDPVAERIGGLALRRGRLGVGLAALQIGRLRNSRRVVALLTIAVGLFVFAVTANDVSVRVRQVQAAHALGAPRVLAVDATNPTQLLAAVRDVDPAGRFAMAVEELPADGRTGAGLLAVDSARLSTVAFWPGTGNPKTLVNAVRPTLAGSVEVTGTAMLVDADFVPAPPVVDPTLQGASLPFDSIRAYFAPLAGGDRILSTEVGLQPGHHTYTLEMTCQAGCRLTGLSPKLFLNDRGAASLTITGLRTADGRTTLATPDQMDRWLDNTLGTFAVTPAALGLQLHPIVGAARNAEIRPPDQTQQLPVIGAGTSEVQVLFADSGQILPDSVATTTALPRLGTAGGLSDLELTTRDGISLRQAQAEVWLNNAAPPDVVAQLAAVGLPVRSDLTVADVAAAAGQRPSALGWRFLMVLGVLALALGVAGLLLASIMERRTRAHALRAMRTQGLSRTAATLSGLFGYLTLVACGAVFGAGAAIVAWWIDGAYLPIVDGQPPGHGLPGWPGAGTLAWWVAAGTVLAVVAVGATVALARGVRMGRRTEFGGGPTS
jgi:hypothetical protein